VAKLVDAPDLGSGAARCESSSLSIRTTLKKQPETAVFLRLNGMKVERMLLAAEIPKVRTMLLISAVGSLKTMA
jgi:hypothetical protein